MDDEFTVTCKKRLVDLTDSHIKNIMALMVRKAIADNMPDSDIEKYNKLLAEMKRRKRPITSDEMITNVFCRPLPDPLEEGYFGADEGDGPDEY